jgi:hypothetical protein
MRVLVCDDRRSECDAAMEAVRKGAPRGTRCEPLHSKDLGAALETLFSVVRDSLDGKTVGKTPFDDQDIIILDNNLSHLDTKGARLTAEAVAGYVRAFATTPYVVSLNKNQEVDFDLQNLIGDNATRADLAVNTAHLENRSLWTGRSVDATDGFCPWYWPALALAPKRRRQQIAFVQRSLKKPILQSFQFPDSAVAALSRHAKGLLSPDAQYVTADAHVGKPISKVTFAEFFHSTARSLPAEEDREKLLKMKNHRIIARTVAGELDVWFRRDVLATQDAIVDVPHLLVRMPFLLGKRAADLRAWNSAVAAERPPFGLEQSLYKKYLSRHRFDLNMWIPAPAFWGRSLKEDDKLSALFFKSEKSKWGDFVFCEDTRLFERRVDDGSSGPKEFVAEFESPWDRRYISNVKKKNYAPRSRLAL